MYNTLVFANIGHTHALYRFYLFWKLISRNKLLHRKIRKNRFLLILGITKKQQEISYLLPTYSNSPRTITTDPVINPYSCTHLHRGCQNIILHLFMTLQILRKVE